MKQTVKILTVDPKTRRIEAVLRDGGGIQVATYAIPTNFVWPKEGEIWTVTRENNFWYLGDRHEVDEDFSIEDMEPGSAKIASDRIHTQSGDEVVAIQGVREDRPDATVPTWDASEEKWKPVPGGSIGVPDKNFVWSQGTAEEYWGIPTGDPSALIHHNLNKRPSVTIVDSAGTEIIVDVKHIDDNKVQIHMSSGTSGKAYFN